MVEAVDDWAYVRLNGEATEVQVGERSASTLWDLAFHSTSVMLNGGAAGPAGVEGYCLCANREVTAQQIQALTAAGELAAFEAVTSADVPASASAWQSDALAPAIAGWYSYDFATHTVAPAAGRSWKVRLADGERYAKLRVVAIAGASQANAGTVTLEYAVQPSRGEALGAVRTLDVDVTAGRAHVDLGAGAVSASAASPWDVALEGYSIRVNGGVSGSGEAGAVLVDEPFAGIADAGDMTDAHYAGDAYGGVFDEHRWYRYNVTGTDHQIWPTYDVYLVRRGGDVWKIQIIGYYGPGGEPRRITFRYAKLDP